MIIVSLVIPKQVYQHIQFKNQPTIPLLNPNFVYLIYILTFLLTVLHIEPPINDPSWIFNSNQKNRTIINQELLNQVNSYHNKFNLG